MFDRPAGSERDLVVLAEALGATVVQRHPVGHRPPGRRFRRAPVGRAQLAPRAADRRRGSTRGRRATVTADRDVIETMLEFAVHDLGARGIGAILVYRPEDDEAPSYEIRLPTPPALNIMTPSNLAPLRHVLSQVDGAAVFDAAGTLARARRAVGAQRHGRVRRRRVSRHAPHSGRRYSFDDKDATVIVVSEDGPVTVLRKGHLLGSSTTIADQIPD